MTLDDWRICYPEAAAVLRSVLIEAPTPPVIEGKSESAAQTEVRIAASHAGWRLWRNNVGAGMVDGQFLRWGLCNDSNTINKRIKSSDLIGIKPGGQFVAREVKQPGWRYRGTEREEAQLRFIEVVVAMGGDAKFTTGDL
jgi:hypothetical protein